MRTTFREVVSMVAILLTCSAAWAGDPWKQKTYKEWDQNEVKRILYDSPWARKVTISLGGGPASVAAGPPSQSPSAGAGSYTGQVGGKTDGGFSGGNPNSVDPAASKTSNEVSFTVRWFTSLTTRRALARANVLTHAMTEAQVEQALAAPVDDYVVVLIGNGMYVFQGMDEAALEKITYLRPKKTKGKLSPTKVDITKGPDGKGVDTLIFHFAKKSANGEVVIASDEKSVEFVCDPKSFTIRTTFEPPKMLAQEGPDI